MTNEVKWYLRRVYGAKAQGDLIFFHMHINLIHL
jgi:hypothetical protein